MSGYHTGKGTPVNTHSYVYTHTHLLVAGDAVSAPVFYILLITF